MIKQQFKRFSQTTIYQDFQAFKINFVSINFESQTVRRGLSELHPRLLAYMAYKMNKIKVCHSFIDLCSITLSRLYYLKQTILNSAFLIQGLSKYIFF